MKFYQKNSHLGRIWIDYFILFERIFNNNKIFLKKLVIFCKVEWTCEIYSFQRFFFKIPCFNPKNCKKATWDFRRLLICKWGHSQLQDEPKKPSVAICSRSRLFWTNCKYRTTTWMHSMQLYLYYRTCFSWLWMFVITHVHTTQQTLQKLQIYVLIFNENPYG